MIPETKKKFSEKFRREEGLIDKYCYDENGDPVSTPDAIEAFIDSVVIPETIQKEREKARNYFYGCTEISWESWEKYINSNQ